MKIKATEIKIMQGDITTLEVDAIVNAANNELVMGGGVAGAIKKKGGHTIEDEAVKLGPIKIGGAVATAAGNLPCKFVIHAATMGMDFKTDEVKVRESCKNAFKVAEELRIVSLAFPALGCGVGGFPPIAAAKIMSQEIWKHVKNKNTSVKEIIFCLFDKEAFDIFTKEVNGYLTHVVEELQAGPFVTVDAIIEIHAGGQDQEGIVVIERSNPPFGLALPGGFVDYGESLEEAVIREAKEETGLDIEKVQQFHTYSAPGRDPRFHTVATVFLARAEGRPVASDDAKGVRIVQAGEVESLDFAFDHKKIIADYLQYKQGNSPF